MVKEGHAKIMTDEFENEVFNSLQGAQYEKLSNLLTPEESILFQEIRESMEYWKTRMLGEL